MFWSPCVVKLIKMFFSERAPGVLICTDALTSRIQLIINYIIDFVCYAICLMACYQNIYIFNDDIVQQ